MTTPISQYESPLNFHPFPCLQRGDEAYQEQKGKTKNNIEGHQYNITSNLFSSVIRAVDSAISHFVSPLCFYPPPCSQKAENECKGQIVKPIISNPPLTSFSS